MLDISHAMQASKSAPYVEEEYPESVQVISDPLVLSRALPQRSAQLGEVGTTRRACATAEKVTATGIYSRSMLKFSSCS